MQRMKYIYDKNGINVEDEVSQLMDRFNKNHK